MSCVGCDVVAGTGRAAANRVARSGDDDAITGVAVDFRGDRRAGGKFAHTNGVGDHFDSGTGTGDEDARAVNAEGIGEDAVAAAFVVADEVRRSDDQRDHAWVEIGWAAVGFGVRENAVIAVTDMQADAGRSQADTIAHDEIGQINGVRFDPDAIAGVAADDVVRTD